MSVVVHEHGVGKRWEGRGYTCTECRNFSRGLARLMAAVTESFVSLADAATAAAKFGSLLPSLISLNDLPLIGEFPPARFRHHSMYGEIDPRRRRRWYRA